MYTYIHTYIHIYIIYIYIYIRGCTCGAFISSQHCGCLSAQPPGSEAEGFRAPEKERTRGFQGVWGLGFRVQGFAPPSFQGLGFRV